VNITQYTGGVITEPGIYSGVDIERYHKDTSLFGGWSISSSGLKALIERPSLYWAHSPYNPNRFDRPDSKALDFGKAAHHLLLEGITGFLDKFAVSPYDDFRTKAAQEWRNDERAAGRTVITPQDLKIIEHIKASLDSHPVIQAGLLRGLIETTMVAKFGNIYLRARPDAVPEASHDHGDLKTTVSVRYDDLERAIYNYGYHIQAAVVRMVSRAVRGEEFGGFAFVFVEKTPPFDVRIVQISDEAMDLGERQVRQGLQMLELCIERGEWPGEEGFSRTISMIGIPAWARGRIETDIAYKAQEIAA
jgi:hypothetical protein